MKRLVVIVLKATVSLGILAYLFVGAHRDGSFARFWSQQKDWTTLALAAVCCFSAVAVTMVRWCYLVRAAGLPFTLKDAFRLVNRAQELIIEEYRAGLVGT